MIEIPEGFGAQALKPNVLQEKSAFGDHNSIGELYHEISHFWNVPDIEPNSMRWNEDLAMFLQYLASDELNNRNTLSTELESDRVNLKSNLERNASNKEIAFRDYGKKGITSLSYTTGAIFFGILFYDLGKERFLEVMRH